MTKGLQHSGVIAVRFLAVAMLCGAATVWPGAAKATPVQPTFTPDPAALVAGQSVTVTLTDPNVPSSGVLAVDLDVTFDPTELAFASVADGSALAGWSVTFGPNGSGNEAISISECGPCNDATPGQILTLTFDALAADPTGTTSFAAATAPFAVSGYGEYQLASLSSTIDVTGAPTVAMLPAPGLACLILPALMMTRSRLRRG